MLKTNHSITSLNTGVKWYLLVKLDLAYKYPFLFILSKFPTSSPRLFRLHSPGYMILPNVPTLLGPPV